MVLLLQVHGNFNFKVTCLLTLSRLTLAPAPSVTLSPSGPWECRLQCCVRMNGLPQWLKCHAGRTFQGASSTISPDWQSSCNLVHLPHRHTTHCPGHWGQEMFLVSTTDFEVLVSVSTWLCGTIQGECLLDLMTKFCVWLFEILIKQLASLRLPQMADLSSPVSAEIRDNQGNMSHIGSWSAGIA